MSSRINGRDYENAMLTKHTLIVEVTGITGAAYPPAILRLLAEKLHAHSYVVTGNRPRPLWVRYHVDNTLLQKHAPALRERADELIQKRGPNLSDGELDELAAVSREADRLILRDIDLFRHPVDVVLRRGGVLQSFIHIEDARWERVRLNRELEPKLLLLLVADKDVMTEAFARDDEFRRLRQTFPQYYCQTVARAQEQQAEWVKVATRLPGARQFERRFYDPDHLATSLCEFIISHSDMAELQTLRRASCFISYSSRDQPFCERLDRDLKANGVITSFFPSEAYDAGEPLWQQIEQSLTASAQVVVVASRDALTSPAVLRELDLANRVEEIRGMRVLRFATVDDYVFEGWRHKLAEGVRDNLVADFRGWQQNDVSFQRGFDKLLAGLRR